MDEDNHIGPFSCFFDEAPLYLEFLSLNAPEPTIRLLQEAIGASSDVGSDLRYMLHGPNWRPHLVAGMALLLNDTPELSRELWSAFDAGSWVAPQLAVVLYFHDPCFSLHARDRLLLRCPVQASPSLAAAEQVSDQGLWKLQQAAKSMSALLALSTSLPGMAKWAGEMGAREDVRSLLGHDCDDGSGLALGWMDRLTQTFAELNLELARAEG